MKFNTDGIQSRRGRTPHRPSLSRGISFHVRIPQWILRLAIGLSLMLARDVPGLAQDADAARFFGIRAVDEQTGRGIPLVELETVNNLRFVTDSAGWIAIDEPSWEGEPVYFHVRSHGYEYPQDGFGFAGTVLTCQPGEPAVLRLKRQNLAERLYRVTGEGIYRDSLLLGEPCPLTHPLGTGKVAGQDSAMAVFYRDKIRWFWGDTNRMRYPLGHYWMAGAISAMPDQGGLAPDLGIDLQYFVGEDGFSRPMARLGVAGGPIWIDAVCILPDEAGNDQLVCHYAHMKSLAEMLDHGLAIYNDDEDQFELLKKLDMNELWKFPGQSHPIRQREGSTTYLHLGEVFPTVRMPATLRDFSTAGNVEAWSCLEPGSDVDDPQFIRSDDGSLQFAWRKDTVPADIAAQWKWIAEGKMTQQEACFVPLDVDSQKPVRMHRGSVAWNAFRNKWIMIGCQQGGTSMLGEIWYAESPTLAGPWKSAKKIVTHDKYSFYNPVHHPFFDQDGGRIIYFEGTYTSTFSGNTTPTPRYDYNQIMYRLDLADPKLKSVQDP